ncbi:MAG: toxin-antitoxin system YwqK family antitoxin [Sphingobacteriales bacterium]|nr:MAG: toxin-antitoxin system YwqK family antitoxin [Sphingobacteriales bacterium]
MQYRLLTLMFLFLTHYSFAQDQLDTLRRKDANGWEFLQIRNFKKVFTEGNLHNGVREGVWTEYWPTEYPSTMTSYSNGKMEGTKIGVDGIGRVQYIENYKNEKLEGPRKVFDPERAGRMVETSYYSDGKKHGNYTKWYGNGQVQETGAYVYDVRDGVSTWYNESGVKSVEYSYRDGKLDGNASTYYGNGKVSAYGRYTNNLQTGEWKEYAENGSLQADGMYKDGEKDGAWKEYDKEGKLVKTVTYKNGVAKN